MKRVIVIGSGGAGKSTLAKALGERLELPVVHLDAQFWQVGWKERDRADWLEWQRTALLDHGRQLRRHAGCAACSG